MRQETRLVKDILRQKYPNKKFQLRYKITTSYVDSSDTLKITCDKSIDINEIISLIQKYVVGIKVFRYGEVVSIYEHYNHINVPKIMSINSHEWIETDMMEFIEVRNK